MALPLKSMLANHKFIDCVCALFPEVLELGEDEQGTPVWKNGEYRDRNGIFYHKLLSCYATGQNLIMVAGTFSLSCLLTIVIQSSPSIPSFYYSFFYLLEIPMPPNYDEEKKHKRGEPNSFSINICFCQNSSPFMFSSFYIQFF